MADEQKHDSTLEKYSDLFKKKAFANLGTLMKDGSPQVTPVWCDFDGKHIRVNSARGRVKDLNMRRDPRVSLAVVDPENPYRYLEIRGKVIEVTEKAPTNTSTASPTNTSAIQNIRSASPAKSASCTRSNLKNSAPWAKPHPTRSLQFVTNL